MSIELTPKQALAMSTIAIEYLKDLRDNLHDNPPHGEPTEDTVKLFDAAIVAAELAIDTMIDKHINNHIACSRCSASGFDPEWTWDTERSQNYHAGECGGNLIVG